MWFNTPQYNKVTTGVVFWPTCMSTCLWHTLVSHPLHTPFGGDLCCLGSWYSWAGDEVFTCLQIAQILCLQKQGCFFSKFEWVFVLELIKMLAAKEIHVPFCPFFTLKKDVETAILLDPVWLMSVCVWGKNQVANDLNTSGALSFGGKGKRKRGEGKTSFLSS